MHTKRKQHPVADAATSKERGAKLNNQPKIYPRLERNIEINTNQGYKTIRALFDTGASIFAIDETWAKSNNMPTLQRDNPVSVFGFSGEQETSFGNNFTPYLTLRIADHETMVSAEVGKLEQGIDLIVPGGWFLVEHPMSFE